ncbi:MAG: LamG-like jellyroll fold domain-containing protein [Persicimonas sp.]
MIEAGVEKPNPTAVDWSRRQDIRADKAGEWARALTWGWCTAGARLGGWLFYPIFATESDSYTVSNETDAGQDIDATSVIIEPQRVELRALAEASGGQDWEDGLYPVVVQAYGSEIEVEIDIEAWDLSNEEWVAYDTVELEIDGKGWAQEVVDLFRGRDGVRGDVFRLTARARSRITDPQDPAELELIAVHELQHHDPTFRLDDVRVYSSEWIGMYADGDDVDAWDADGVGQHELADGGQAPSMSRDDPFDLVHSVDFGDTGDEYTLESEAFEVNASFVVALAVRPGGSELGVLHKAGNADDTLDIWIDANDELNVRLSYDDGSSVTTTTLSAAVSPPAWHDVAVWWDGETLRLFVDGILEDDGAADGDLDDDVTALVLGEDGATGGEGFFDGRMALPCLIESDDLDALELLHLVHWRRSMHGIW